MQSSLLTNILLFLSFLNVLALAAPETPGPVLTVRQSTAPDCQDYSRTANLSTIGGNSSYRSLFLAASPVGTLSNSKMLNAAVAKLPALTMDATLNGQCGNLTTVALVEAEKNFTRGVVGQFDGLVPGTIKAGPELMVIVGAVCTVFSVVWIFSP